VAGDRHSKSGEGIGSNVGREMGGGGVSVRRLEGKGGKWRENLKIKLMQTHQYPRKFGNQSLLGHGKDFQKKVERENSARGG